MRSNSMYFDNLEDIFFFQTLFPRHISQQYKKECCKIIGIRVCNYK